MQGLYNSIAYLSQLARCTGIITRYKGLNIPIETLPDTQKGGRQFFSVLKAEFPDREVMTKAMVVHTNLPASECAGSTLGAQIARSFDRAPDVAILFISRIYKPAELLQAFKQACNPKILIGCSSSGEFTSNAGGVGLASAIALCSDDMHFSTAIGHNLSKDRAHAARQIATSFRHNDSSAYPFRSIFLVMDIFSGSVETFVQHLAESVDPGYQIFGGGASDSHWFEHTPVFYGTETYTNAAVALEILSHKPIGIGLRHEWYPVAGPWLVTGAHGPHIMSINHRPAIEVFQAYAEERKQEFSSVNAGPFFTQNLIGIPIKDGDATQYRLRVPIRAELDGSIFCPAEVSEGDSIYLMNCSFEQSIQSAEKATSEAIEQLQGHKPAVALFFDCPVSRLRLKEHFDTICQAVQTKLPDTPYIGCQLYGQIVHDQSDQPHRFHTCTPMVCVFPQ